MLKNTQVISCTQDIVSGDIPEKIKKRYKKYSRYHATKNRTVTEKAVIWVGYACDAMCVFCYNEGMKRSWRPLNGLDGLKEKIFQYRFEYGNQCIDFMGGEPTLHPEIIELIEYCVSIGIQPTCITNAIQLSDRGLLENLKGAGIFDFLVSIHGIGETQEKILNVKQKGNFQKQLLSLENMISQNIPFRFNTTMIDWNKKDLPKIARLAAEMGALTCNWIMFNPHFSWTKTLNIEFQARYSEIVPYLKEAIKICETHGIESNVRYLPFCQLKGYEKYIYNCGQLPFDHNEWDYNSWHNYHQNNPRREWYDKAAEDQRRRNKYKKSPICQKCALNAICDGFQSQYADRFGFRECQPYIDHAAITQPTEFIQHQWKIEPRKFIDKSK